MDAQAILIELQALRSNEPATAVTRLRELADALEQTMSADRSIAPALTHQAIIYLCEGVESGQNPIEVNRRFTMVTQRAEAWARGSS